MRIAMLQMPVGNCKEENLDTACQYIRQAAGNGADIAVLPEMFNCPYTSDYFRRFAEPEGALSWQRISQCAAELNIYVVAGSIPESADGKIYNTSFVFGKDGQPLARHRKMHLFDIDVKGGQVFRESDTFTAGDSVTTFEANGVKIGVCICFDFRFPELARLMALDGVQIIIVPAAFNMTTGPLHWETMFRQRATDNQVFTVGVAPARDTAGVYVSYAHSMACSPWGKVLQQADENPGIVYVDLNLLEVQEVRTQLPLLSARRTDIYSIEKIK